MTSFEETLFKALLPVFARALEAANAAGTDPAPVAQPQAPVAATTARPLDLPKAA